MVEELGAVLRNGFETWKNNLNIALPFVLSLAFTLIVMIFVLGAAVLVAFGPLLTPLLPAVIESGEIPPEVIEQLQPQILQNLGLLIGAIIVMILLLLLINTFFTAGAIGMAKEATEQRKTSLATMTACGKRKYLSLLLANVIIGLIALAGVVFLLPGVLLLLPAASTSPPFSGGGATAAFAALALGSFLMSIYLLLVSIIFAVTPYAVVLDDLRAVDGVKRGFRFFRAHKLAVFLLWLVVLVITFAVGILTMTIPTIGHLLNMAVSVAVIQPLIVIWWSRLYLSEKASLSGNQDSRPGVLRPQLE
ncbi:MAG TPA: hypothetical protein ENN68_01390 [Methanomicrobia archaeon]|nr:hypothetical protein [Methanomicrobia archaeon]